MKINSHKKKPYSNIKVNDKKNNSELMSKPLKSSKVKQANKQNKNDDMKDLNEFEVKI